MITLDAGTVNGGGVSAGCGYWGLLTKTEIIVR
jgi:hypothetical protein